MENSRKRNINWGEAVVPGLILLFVLAYFIQTDDAPVKALYWPLGVTLILAGLWAAVLAKFLRSPATGQEKGKSWDWALMRARYARSLLIGGGSVLYLILVAYIGFSISNFLFIQAVCRGLGSRRWMVNVLVGLGIAGFLHLALIYFMQLSLPRLELGPVTI